MKKMNQALKKVWVEALLSGRFKQTKYVLRVEDKHNPDDSREYSYCPLGVLCVLTGFKPTSWYNTYPKTDSSESTDIGEYKVEKFHDIKPVEQFEISMLNDSGKSFQDIAKWIDINL